MISFWINGQIVTPLFKKYLEDEQSRRKESQIPESIQGLDQDKGQDREEDPSRGDQGDAVHAGPREGREGEGNEVVPPRDDIDTRKSANSGNTAY